MGNAFTGPGKAAYHYQYSVPFASHASDLAGYFGPATPNQGPDFALAFRRLFSPPRSPLTTQQLTGAEIWGNVVMNNNPSIPNEIANGARSPTPHAPNPASRWPAWTVSNPMMINLNETGGTPFTIPGAAGPITEYMDPGLGNNITLANAYTWELNRGQRCDFWKNLGPSVPE
jgi:hypothetical protein